MRPHVHLQIRFAAETRLAHRTMIGLVPRMELHVHVIRRGGGQHLAAHLARLRLGPRTFLDSLLARGLTTGCLLLHALILLLLTLLLRLLLTLLLRLLLRLLLTLLLIQLQRLLLWLHVALLLGELLPIVGQVHHGIGSVRATGSDRVEPHGLALDLLVEHGCHYVRLLRMSQLLSLLVLLLRRLLMGEQSQIALDKLLISCVPIHLCARAKR